LSRHKIISAEDAARVVMDGDTVATSGFVGVGFPEELAVALERRFVENSSPKDLTLVYAAGRCSSTSSGSEPGRRRRKVIGPSRRAAQVSLSVMNLVSSKTRLGLLV
jgi:acyl CoA:acetate/3-ketoacid CoA transferase